MSRAKMIVLAAVLIMSSLVFVQAQEKDDDLEKKKADHIYKVVVTANRREAAQKDIPLSTTVVSREQLANTAGLAIEDVLKSVASIDLWGSSIAYKCAHGMSLRGTETMGRTLVLIDGIPLNDAWDDWVDWNLASLDGTQRIEVVRGPVSSLYGSNAMGGVINIFTLPLRKEPLYSRFGFKYGSMNSWQSSFNVGGNEGQYSWQLNGNGKQTDGYLPYAKPQNNESRNESKEFNIGGKLGWNPDENTSIIASGSFMHHERNRGREYQRVDPQDISRFNVRFNRKEENIIWDGHVYYQDKHLKWYLDKGPKWDAIHFAEDIYSSFWGASINPKIFLNKDNTLSLGAEFKHSDIEKTDIYFSEIRDAFQSGKQQYLAAFAQNETSLFDGKGMVSIGGRIDYWRNFSGYGMDTNPHRVPAFDESYDDTDWTAFNPKVSFIYDLTEDLVFRTSVGTGFRTPSPARQFLNLTRGPFLFLSNPNLKAEKLISGEAGLELHGENSLLKVTGYYSKGDDFIGSRVVKAPFLQIMDNINEVTIGGVELEYQQQITKAFSLTSSYVYNRSVVADDIQNPSLIDNDLLHSPRNKFNLLLNYHNPEIGNMSLATRFVDKMYDDIANTRELFSYWTTDMKYRKRVTDNLDLTLECINLFDEEYLLPSYDIYKAPGRIIMAGFQIDY